MHFQSAREYFRRGDYEDAEREFAAAYRLSGRVELLYNLYVSRERLGRYAAAADALEEYIERGEDSANRADLESRLENLRERAAEQASEAAIAASEAESDAADTDEGERAWLHPATLSAFGIGAAGLLTMTVAGGLAIAEDRSLASECGRDAGRVCTDEELSSLERRTRTADVGLALGLAGVATGLILAFVLDTKDERDGSEAFTVNATAVVGRAFTGIITEVRF